MKSPVVKHFALLIALAVVFTESAPLKAQTLTASEQAMTKEKILDLYIKISAPLDSVWSRWTTEKGIKKFFAPACRLEAKPLGRLDIFFAPDAPPGQRGAEDNLVLALQDKKMISFTWDCPPQWPEMRKQRTTVAVRFYSTGNTETLVTLTQTGWGVGSEWDAVYTYFGNAWADFVLPNLKYSLEVKAIDWTNFPQNAPKGLKPAEKL
jgi:uncharacterized protein YndB with AHSA1/START domain